MSPSLSEPLFCPASRRKHDPPQCRWATGRLRLLSKLQICTYRAEGSAYNYLQFYSF